MSFFYLSYTPRHFKNLIPFFLLSQKLSVFFQLFLHLKVSQFGLLLVLGEVRPSFCIA